MTVTITENSWLAKLAARKLKAEKMAIVIGAKIHLYNCSKDEFLRNKKWVRHEVAHVHQWLKFGKVRFTVLYLLESFNKGYFHNKYEAEARSRENDNEILNDVTFV